MAMYINSNLYLESFKQTVSGKYYVDKSEIISDLIPYLNIEERFLCITRPRRFGKTIAANDDFYISREDKAGKGFADFVFISKNSTNPNIVLELEVDSTAEKALEQIKQKEYTFRFSKQSLSNQVLLVGISYSKKTKKHYCMIVAKKC